MKRILNLDRYCDRINSAYNSFDVSGDPIQYLHMLIDQDDDGELKQSYIDEVIYRYCTAQVGPLACFTYAGYVARILDELGYNYQIVLGTCASSQDRTSDEELHEMPLVNHVWVETRDNSFESSRFNNYRHVPKYLYDVTTNTLKSF